MSNLGIAQSNLTGKGGSGGSGSTFNFRGAWSNVTSYATNDVVTRKGTSYVAVSGSTGQDPYLDTTQTFWKVMTQGFNFTGTWLVGTSYNFFDVVLLNNSFYLSVLPGEQTNTGHNPQTDAAGGVGTNWALLDQGFKWQGTYAGGTTYQAYDTVAYNSSSYISLTFNNTGNQPDISPANWALLAASGQVAPRQTYTFTLPSATITNIQITSNVLTITAANTFAANGFGTGTGQLNTFYLTGLTTATFLNGQILTVTAVTGTTLTATFVHADYPSAADTGTVYMSMPNNALYFTFIPLGKTFALSYLQCGSATRVELYSSQLSRTNDVGRPATVQPTQFTQHGVILDLNLDGVVAAYSSWILSPLAYGANVDLGQPDLDTINIPATLTNLGGATTVSIGGGSPSGFYIIFTFTYEEQ